MYIHYQTMQPSLNEYTHISIAPDKRAIKIIFFLIPPQEHKLWVLIRSTLMRLFLGVLTIYTLMEE